jgi:hypothetical protein
VADTLVSRLQAQRATLIDVVRQIDVALASIYAPPAPVVIQAPARKPRVKHRKALRPEQWQYGRQLFETGERVAVIAQRIGAHQSMIYHRIKVQGWQRNGMLAESVS